MSDASLGEFKNIDELLEFAAPQFIHSIGILMSHVNGEGSPILAGLQDTGNRVIQKGEGGTKDIRLFGAYGQYCKPTHDSLTIELHRMIADHHDIIVTVGPAITERVEKIIQETQSEHLPRMVSLAAFTDKPLSYNITGFDPAALVQEVTRTFASVKKPHIPHQLIASDHKWKDSILNPLVQSFAKNSITATTAAVDSYKELVLRTPDDADALIVLPHDITLDHHLMLHSFCQERNIPLIVCSHGATKIKSSPLAYAADMRAFGRDAGEYLAQALKERKDIESDRCEADYTVSRSQDD